MDADRPAPHATNLQKSKLLERTTGLRRRVAAWIEVQALFIPGTVQLRAKLARDAPASAPEVKVWDIDLWLPSAMHPDAACDQHLQEYEWQIREAQAHDALHELRQYLRLETFLTKRKRDWDRGVCQNTRSQSAIRQVELKRGASAAKYRAARRALVTLAPRLSKPPGWERELKILTSDDIQPMPVGGELGEGRRRLSWIWMSPGVGLSEEEGMHDGTHASNVPLQVQSHSTPNSVTHSMVPLQG